MARFVYTAWFCDLRLPPDDQDYEWPACFVVEADSPQRALAWGDHLAKRYAIISGEPLSQSHVEPVASHNEATLPIVLDGHEATDEEIGW